MNVYDSVRMTELLTPLGYTPVDEPDSANLVVLNTCHIREKAAEKIFSDLGRLRALGAKRRASSPDGDDLIIAVAGCVAQAEGAEIMRRAPFVDIVLGPQTYHRLPEMVARAQRESARRARGGVGRSPRPGIGILDIEFPPQSKFDSLPTASAPQGPSAFLTVQEGCDKFCSFCVVPYTRGVEYSRPAAQVIAEARAMVADGAREITLLGQNVNAYHGIAPKGKTEWGLGRLIRVLAEIDGLERIRFTTSHPRDMDDDLIAVHGDTPELMPYLHLPVQSGSDRMLEAMNRQHTVADYRRLVDSLRAARRDLALSSDFIVGHPDERDEDFAATLDLVRAVGYAQAYSFKYSARPGTPAASARVQVAEEIKERRLAELQSLLRSQQSAFNRGFAGRMLPVLFDRRGRGTHQAAGRSPYMQAVHVDCADAAEADRLHGAIAPVKVREVFANSLSGELGSAAADSRKAPPAGPEPVFA